MSSPSRKQRGSVSTFDGILNLRRAIGTKHSLAYFCRRQGVSRFPGSRRFRRRNRKIKTSWHGHLARRLHDFEKRCAITGRLAEDPSLNTGEIRCWKKESEGMYAMRILRDMQQGTMIRHWSSPPGPSTASGTHFRGNALGKSVSTTIVV